MFFKTLWVLLDSRHQFLSGHKKNSINSGLKLFVILPRMKSVKSKAFKSEKNTSSCHGVSYNVLIVDNNIWLIITLQ